MISGSACAPWQTIISRHWNIAQKASTDRSSAGSDAPARARKRQSGLICILWRRTIPAPISRAHDPRSSGQAHSSNYRFVIVLPQLSIEQGIAAFDPVLLLSGVKGDLGAGQAPSEERMTQAARGLRYYRTSAVGAQLGENHLYGMSAFGPRRDISPGCAADERSL